MKIKNKIKSLSLYLSFFFVLAVILDITLFQAYVFAQRKATELFPAYSSYMVSTTRQAVADELTPKEYIWQEAQQAGLNIAKVDCLIDSESKYINDWNVNKNGTVDFGYWMINSIHIKSGIITLECATDLICSTDWAIERLKQGKWNMWAGWKSNCK